MLFQLQEWDYCRVKDIMKLLFRSHAPSRHHGFIYEVPVAWTCSGFDNEAGYPGHRYAASRSGSMHSIVIPCLGNSRPIELVPQSYLFIRFPLEVQGIYPIGAAITVT